MPVVFALASAKAIDGPLDYFLVEHHKISKMGIRATPYRTIHFHVVPTASSSSFANIRERKMLVNWWISGVVPEIYVVIPYFGLNTFIHHKYFTLLNLFTHLFYMSVHFNNFMLGTRHILQVFPSASWSVAYCLRSCLEVSSCFSLLWTSSFLDEYNLITDDGIAGQCVCTINIGAPFWFMYVW